MVWKKMGKQLQEHGCLPVILNVRFENFYHGLILKNWFSCRAKFISRGTYRLCVFKVPSIFL